jgi:hypothetical protein
MKPDWQRILIILAFVASIFLFAFFLYWFFWRPLMGPTITTTPTSTTTGGLPSAGTAGVRTTTGVITGGLPVGGQSTQILDENPAPGTAPSRSIKATAIVESPAYFASLSTNGDLCYYNPNDAKFYQNVNGLSTALSDNKFSSVSQATFDAGCKKAIIEYPDGSNIVYDFSAKKQYTLPAHWQGFSFSETGDKIAFKNIGLDPDNRYLVAAKYDGTQTKILEQIGVNADKVTVNWSPNNQVVATYIEGIDSTRSEVYFIGQNNENFKSMVVEGRGFNGVWSPSGQQMLYSVYDANNDYKPSLWISGASGDNVGANRRQISLNTWADQCVFASETYALCLAPQTMPAGAGLDRENLTGTLPSSVWAIDLRTGATALAAVPQNITTMDKLMINPNSPQSIYVVNSDNKYIYEINLAQ